MTTISKSLNSQTRIAKDPNVKIDVFENCVSRSLIDSDDMLPAIFIRKE